MATQDDAKLVTLVEREGSLPVREVDTRWGVVRVHVQGAMDARAVFLTLHDIGSNHSAWRDFVESSAREEVVLKVLDSLHVPLIVGLGEGAGANALARFGLAHPERVLGLVLVELVSAGVGLLGALRDRVRRNSHSALDIVTLHKIGSTERDESISKELMENYSKRVQNLNAKNVSRYAQSYANRKEISCLGELDVLLVTASKGLYCAGVESIHAKCNKSKTSLLKAEAVDVLSECPEKLVKSLLLFVKGLGFLTSCPSADSPSIRSDLRSLGSIGRRRTLSMEEYDIPRMRRLSLSK